MELPYVLSLHGFDQRHALQYGLNDTQAAVVGWFANFSLTGNQEKKDYKGKTYYWVVYSKVVEDLPLCHLHPAYIGILFRKFTSGPTPILEKYLTSVRGKPRIYYRFIDGVHPFLLGHSMPKLIESIDEPASKKKYRTLHPEVVHILDELYDIETIGKDGEPKTLFSYTKKAYENDESKFAYMKKFNDYCLDIYNGTFTRHKYPWTDDFLSKNNWFIDEEKNRIKLKACKNNWAKVKQIIISAAIHYEQWFHEESGKANFARDNTNIGSWMYDSFTGSSLFYACIQNRIPVARDIAQNKIADEIVNELPDPIYRETKQLTHSMFVGCNKTEDAQIWIAIEKVYELERLIRKTYKSDNCVATYLGPPTVWTVEYLQWLPTCWGPSTSTMLKPYHVGIKGKPWIDFLKSNVDLVETLGLDTLVEMSNRI